jgi:hypothetical protein
MPRKKRGRREVALAKAVTERLRTRYLSGPDGISQGDLARRLFLKPQTVNGWFANPPAIPDVYTLVALAERDNWNLNHLLLGDGPPLRGQTMAPPSLATAVRDHVAAELRAEIIPVSIVEPGAVILARAVKHYRERYQLATALELHDIRADPRIKLTGGRR